MNFYDSLFNDIDLVLGAEITDYKFVVKYEVLVWQKIMGKWLLTSFLTIG